LLRPYLGGSSIFEEIIAPELVASARAVLQQNRVSIDYRTTNHTTYQIALQVMRSRFGRPFDQSNCVHTLRIDIQNFGRCCATIAFAELKYNTQLIKDVADGSFRAGEYEKAFLTFEQLVTGFTSAVNSSRQAIADARRELIAEKGQLSGREVMDRTAALVRREQRVFAAEREFNKILEGLRMYVMEKH
jgi:hypothetical protein